MALGIAQCVGTLRAGECHLCCSQCHDFAGVWLSLAGGDGEAVTVAYHVAYGVLAAGVMAVVLLLARVMVLGFACLLPKNGHFSNA